jgi:hypothetical protein
MWLFNHLFSTAFGNCSQASSSGKSGRKETEGSSGMTSSPGNIVGIKAAATFWKQSGYNIGLKQT